MTKTEKPLKKTEFIEEESSLQKSSCSLWLVIVTLLFIFLIFLGGVLYLKTKDIFTLSNKVTTQNSNNDVLNSKFSETTLKQPGEPIAITLTDDDLNSALISVSDFPLKKPKIHISSDKILVSGKTSDNIFSLSVDVSIVPKATEGKIKFSITEIKAGGVSAPKKISDELNNSLSSYLDKLMPGASSINITEVKLNNGYLEVIGTKK